MHVNPELALMQSQWGIYTDAVDYIRPEWKRDFRLAMDAQPGLVTTPNSGIPAMLTTMIDPNILKVLIAPNKLATIFSEVRKGSWLDQTIMFPLVERDGEVSSYGDFAENGHAGVNYEFPQRQSYLYQTIIEYGELEMERAGLARIAWAAALNEAAILVLNKFQNFTYAFGVQGLQNYGLLNDPYLSASLTPALKAYGGVKWINAGVIAAQANEVYLDIQSLFLELVAQAGGLITQEDRLVLAMSPSSATALTATNSFNVNVNDLLKKNFPNLRIETAVQYGAISAANPQGIAAGNFVQLICESVEGQDTGYCAFNEKLRAHPIIRAMSSFKQKMTQGTWGAVVRQPFAIASMVGV